MTKLKKFLTIFLIFFVTFLVLFTNKASAESLGDSFTIENDIIKDSSISSLNGKNWRDVLFCIEHNAGFSNSATYTASLYSETDTIYRSDSNNPFERGIAYILYKAYQNNMNCYGWNTNGGERYNGNEYQQALWKYLWRNRESSYYKNSIFKGSDLAPVNDELSTTYTDETEKLYNEAIDINYNFTDFSTQAEVKVKDFIMEGSTGSFVISKLSKNAKVTEIEVTWSDGKSEKYTGSHPNFQLTNLSNGLNGIAKDSKINITNKKDYKISKIEVSAKCQKSGYAVRIYRYGIGDAQDLIYTEIIEPEEKTNSCSVEAVYRGYQLQLRKVDHANQNILLNNCGFAIYLDVDENSKDRNNANDGWLGYDTNKKNVEFGKTYAESYKFITGENYCNVGNRNGSIVLNNLVPGTYYIFETQAKKGYSLDSQFWYNKIEGNFTFPKGKEITENYVYGGNILIEEDDKGSGFSEKNTKIITNRKTTELKIVKRDEKNAEKTIAGVGIKILVEKIEHADYMGEFKDIKFVWLKRDGSFSTDCNDPECEFITDSKGEINIKGVPYGKYYIYEVTPADNYSLSRQKGYKQGKPTGYEGTFPEERADLNPYYLDKNLKPIIIKDEEHGIIKDGTYTIASSMNEIYVIDIAGGSQDSGANARIYYNNGTDAQKYEFIYVGDGYYMIKNVNSGKFLDLSGGIIDKHRNIHQYAVNYTNAQLWKITQETDPTGYIMYVIKPKGNDNYCIGVNGNLADNGANIELQEFKANKGTQNKDNVYSQRFTFYENDITQYSIKPFNPKAPADDNTQNVSKHYVSLKSTNIRSEIFTQQKDKLGEKETFQIVRAIYKEWTTPRYFIYNRKAQFVFDVAGSKVTEVENKENVWKGKLQLYTVNKTGAQKWKLQDGKEAKGSTNYINNISSIEDLNTGHTLKFISDANENKPTAFNLVGNVVGKNLQVYTDDGTDACKFVVKKINNGSLVKPLETENSQRTITFEAVNKEGGDGKITIIKQDKDNSKMLQGAEFKIYKENGGWVTQDGEEISYNTDYSKATAFVTDENGQKVINNLYLGDYYIYETKAPANYSLSQQEGYLRGEKGSESITDKEWVYAGNCKIDKTSKEIELPLKNEKRGSITIIKQDKDNSEKLQGAEFKIYNENVGWLTQNGKKIEYNKDYSKATAFVTNENGKIEINNIDLGNYYIYETKAPTNYYLGVQEGYRKADEGSESITEKDWVYVGSYKIDKTHKEIEVPLKNDKHIGSLTITKQDSDTKEKLVGTEFKLYATNLNTNIIAGGKGWVTLNNGQIGYSTDYNNANAFTTNNEGTVLVENLSYGTYYIYETKAPTGYNIKEQDSYHVQQEGSTTIPQDQDWVALGNGQISSQNKEVKVTLNNHKYTKIKGRVWQDNPDGKANAYNNIYDGKAWTSQDQNITNDSLISGITVNLYSNKNGNDELISTTTTGENGEYEFEKKTEGEHKGDKLTYLELENSYVEFVYDNTQYVLATPFVGDDMTVNSKAQAKEINTTGGEHNMGELYDGNLGLNEGKFPGKAVTYQENDGQTQQKITEYYNNDTYTIENINLGLIKKLPNEFAVNQELEYVKIVKENYTFTYKYGENAVIDEDTQKTQSTIAFQNSKRTFTHAVYPSDIKYNIANGLDENADGAYKIYVVYKIGVKNTTPHNNPDLYQEDKFYLTSLVNTYDTTRLQLSADEIGNEDENAQFRLWSNNNGQATYDLTNTNNVYKDGLAKNETKESYIQFKVTQSALIDLITKSNEERESIFANAPTKVNAKGYHIYKRNDKNWKDKELYTHRTTDTEANDGALFIKWKLADTRKISGVVFEDTKVNQIKDEEQNSRENERIGNGKLDIDENNGTYKENTVSDVIVSLMDAETKKVAKVYNGDLVRGADGIWKATSRDAIVKVKDDGSYEIPDVVPGRYYLKFTYGNGKTEYTDLNGNKIEEIATKIKGQEEPIKSYLYKSTIITGAAYDANSENEKTWFLKSIDEGVYSIAVDDENEINNRIERDNLNKELNYDYTTKQSSSTINANSPIMNIQFEYIPETEIDANLLRNDPNNQNPLRTNCTGMSFGIIERPHVNIELQKKIKNVKLTLQNGTTIINGDPKDKNVSPNLASIDDSNAKLELDSSYIYGSNAVVTYTLSAENKSELDYATPEYYKYGEDKNNLVTTTVTKIADYINNQNASYENQSENVKVLNDTEKDNYFLTDVSNKNKNYKQTVFITDKALLPEAATPDDLSRSRTDEYEFTVNNLLSTSDGALGWESYAEIIGITNITLTPQSVSKSGNYVVGDNSTKEADTAEATISIYSSTGENRNLVIYYVIGGALLIIAVGIVLIKKFVIKTK